MNTPSKFSLITKLILAGVLVLVLALTWPTPARSATFTDDFSTGLNPAYWNIIQSIPGLYSVNAAQGNVQLAKIAAHNPGGVQYVFVRVNLAALGGSITNDFSTQVSFSGAVVPGPGLDQVELHTYYQDGSIFYTVYDRSSGLNVHVWDGGAVRGAQAVAGNAGTFRISRTGATVTGYFNGTSIYSTSRATPVVAIDFVLQNNAGSDDAISVTFDDFSVTAASVRPVLSIAAVGGAQVQLAWTTNSAGYQLEQSPQLNGASWSGVTNVPTVTGDHFVLPLSAGDTQRFFRLHKP